MDSTDETSIATLAASERHRKDRRKSLDSLVLKGKDPETDESDDDDEQREVGGKCLHCNFLTMWCTRIFNGAVGWCRILNFPLL